MRIVVVVCVVALIAALTVFVLLQLEDGTVPDPGEGPATKESSVPPSTEPAPENRPASPRTTGPSRKTDPPPPAEAPTLPEPNPAPATTPTATETSWVIVGTVRAVGAPMPGQVALAVAAIREGGRAGSRLTESTPFDDAFELRVTSLIAAHPDLAELEVTFDHPRYKPQLLRISIPESVRQATGPRCTIAEMNVTLHPAGSFTGLVRDHAGRPVNGAAVAAFRVVGEVPSTKRVAGTHTDAEGRYRLRIGTETRYFVAAAAATLRPAGAFAFGAHGRDTHLSDLVLTPGATVQGTVRLNGSPASRATVTARYLNPHGKSRLSLASGYAGQVVFLDGKLDRDRGRARTDASGRYRIEGLGPIPYRIRPTRVHGVSSEVSNKFQPRPIVKPPAVGVDFEVAAVVVTVEVRSPDGPVPGAHVMLHAPSCSASHATREDGRFRTLLAPQTRYTLEVLSKGFARKKLELNTGSAARPQTVVITLKPLPKSGGVAVTVVTDGSPGPRRLPFWLDPIDGKVEAVRRNVVGEDGVFRLEGVTPAEYVLTVAHRLSGAATYYCEKKARVKVKTGQWTPLELRLRLGGRIRVSVRDAEGRFVARRCRVVGASGKAHKLWFRRLDLSGGWSASTDSTHARGPAETFPSIQPGTYRVEFPDQAGVVEKAINVRVKPGETTDVVWKVE